MKICFQSLFFIIQIAILLASIAPVYAEENTSAPTAKAISAIPLPQLNFEKIPSKIIATGELSPGKTVQLANIDSNGKKTSTVSSQIRTPIPMGAIVYHYDNITTVFDATGQQIFVVDDINSSTIRTFKGDQPATFIHEVPDKSVVVNNGDSLTIVYNNARILSIIDANDKQSLRNPRYAPTTATTCDGGNIPWEYIEGTESSFIANPGRFSADWVVPSSPLDPGLTNEKYVTIWNGFFGCVDGDPADTLIQPVLEWCVTDDLINPPATPQWTMSTWYLWGNGQNITVNGKKVVFIHSERVFGILPGDTIKGEIKIQPDGTYDAIGSIHDSREGIPTSTLFLTENTPVPERMPIHNLIATVVLEGWRVDFADDANAENLPTPVIFKDFILTDHEDNNILPTTSMTSFVNSQFWNQNTFADSDNLTVYNQWPTSIILVNNRDRLNPPVADFTTTVPWGIGVAYVPFQDTSTNSPFLWYWNFGDGSTSTEQNPFHYYQTPGSYTVNLTVWGPGGINSKVKPGYITVLPFIPIPVFIVNVTSGNAPLTVQFNDISTNSPTYWNWSFGDGTYSTIRNVSHIYTNAGIYNATLTAGNAGGNSTSAPQTITVISSPPLANFTANVTSGTVPLTVRFNDTSTKNPTSWNWSFGDGQTSTIQNPTHTYTSSGLYNISLTVANGGGNNTITRNNFINASRTRTPIWIITEKPNGSLNPYVSVSINGGNPVLVPPISYPNGQGISTNMGNYGLLYVDTDTPVTITLTKSGYSTTIVVRTFNTSSSTQYVEIPMISVRTPIWIISENADGSLNPYVGVSISGGNPVLLPPISYPNGQGISTDMGNYGRLLVDSGTPVTITLTKSGYPITTEVRTFSYSSSLQYVEIRMDPTRTPVWIISENADGSLNPYVSVSITGGNPVLNSPVNSDNLQGLSTNMGNFGSFLVNISTPVTITLTKTGYPTTTEVRTFSYSSFIQYMEIPMTESRMKSSTVRPQSADLSELAVIQPNSTILTMLRKETKNITPQLVPVTIKKIIPVSPNGTSSDPIPVTRGYYEGTG